MTKSLVTSFLILSLVAGLGTSPADAKSCRRRCRRAVAICAAKHCGQLAGRLRAGCRLGLRITLVAACKVAPEGNVCETIQAESCANN